MKLYLTRCVASGTTLFSIYSESGEYCCPVQTLSGILSSGFQITGRLIGTETTVNVSQMLFPHIRYFSVQVDGIRRANLRTMLDGSVRTLRLDGLDCTVLGRPPLGEYTVLTQDKQILFSQRLYAKSIGRTSYELMIRDTVNTPVCVGLAVCLTQNLPASSISWIPVSVNSP